MIILLALFNLSIVQQNSDLPRTTTYIGHFFPQIVLNMYNVNKQNPDSPRLFIPPKLTVSWGFTAYNFY